MRLLDAYVDLRVRKELLKRDVEQGIQEGARSANVDRAGDEAGRRFAKKFSAGVKAHVNLSGIAGGAGLFAGGSGLLGAASGLVAGAAPLAAAGAAVAAFGAVAIPTLTKVAAAQAKLTAAQAQYAKATTTAGRASALQAEAAATAKLTGSEKALLGPMSQLSTMWGRLESSMAPALGGILKFTVVILRDAMPAIRTLATVGAHILTAFAVSFDKLLNTEGFRRFIASFAKFGEIAGRLLAPALTQLLGLFMRFFIQLMPTGVRVLQTLLPFLLQLTRTLMTLIIQLLPSGLVILQALLPALVQIVTDLTPTIVLISNITAATVKWLAANHLLVPTLAAVGIALGLAMDTNPVGALILVIGGLVVLITEIVNHWKTLSGWITSHWPLVVGIIALIFPPLAAVVVAVKLIADHWHGVVNAAVAAWHGVTAATKAALNFLAPLFHVIAVAAKIAWLTVSTAAKIAWDIVSGLVLAWWHIVGRPTFLAIQFLAKVTWQVVSATAKFMWNNILHPIFNAIASVAKTVWHAVSSLAQVAWNVIKAGVRFLWNVISGVFGAIIHGAATAFGWVWGLGPKLKKAAHEFDIFRNRVNAAINGVQGRKVSVQVTFGAYGGGKSSVTRAAGGPIYDGTGPTADDVLIRASRGEWVVKAASAAKYGPKAMAAVNEGRAVIGYARGGPVGHAGEVSVRPVLPSGRTVEAAINAALLAYVKANAPRPGGGGYPGGGASGPGAAAAQRYAASILGLYGWGPNQMPPLIALWNGESGWNYLAYNASSGATGIPQALPGSKMAAAGADWRTNPATQIRWGLGYIRSMYGSPAAAYGAWLSRMPHWYREGGPVARSFDTGGSLPPGLSLSWNGTGRWERLDRRGGGTGRTAPAMYVENQYVQDRTDAELIGSRVAWSWREGGFGGGRR